MNPEPGSLSHHLFELARRNRDQRLRDWLDRCIIAATCREREEALPAWSVGELLAVAVILDDTSLLADLDYTREEAIERIRWDIGATEPEAEQIIADLRGRLER
ncbi:hypothetical protein Br6_04840 [Rhodococcus sp. Br-6]|nr:hypothetical protein Br6_04840 [Rhodococcus sp. Br-6]